nr:Arm DNA-binding domain-containing protein [Virgibacillus halodenitrificans]
MAVSARRKNAVDFVIDIGIDPVTGKRKQKTKGGFTTKQETEKQPLLSSTS